MASKHLVTDIGVGISDTASEIYQSALRRQMRDPEKKMISDLERGQLDFSFVLKD